ncbi:fused [Paragonimus westermani]|uniref:non-specific serine/threonine protein kinase n=1 Tax=Paragonimus westermani TaxID=34504 RepID=A0A5J4NNM8_9TREM|nr:fused [Paragonimus westermani]
MGLERYTVLECIGEGSFGRVYRGRVKDNGQVQNGICTDNIFQIVAMKFIPKVGKSEKSLRNLKREIGIMQSMHHANIIEMKDTFETEREVVAITDYAEGDLFQIIEDDGQLSEEIVRSIACQLVSALYYLHAHRILHRDMKPQNILLGQEGVVKLCDFGFARVMNLNSMVLTSIKGTPLYMAPEALGCILYELFVGKPPFYTESIFQLVKMITKMSIQWPPDMNPEFKDFLTRLLQKDVRKRLQWPELLDHPFIAAGIQISPRTRQLSSPFTQPLTPSQLAEKERQTQQMSRPSGSRILRRVGGERIHSLKQVQEERSVDISQSRNEKPSAVLYNEHSVTGSSNQMQNSNRKLTQNAVAEETMQFNTPGSTDAFKGQNRKTNSPERRPQSCNAVKVPESSSIPSIRNQPCNETKTSALPYIPSRGLVKPEHHRNGGTEAPPTPRTDRISTDYAREQGIYEDYLKVKDTCRTAAATGASIGQKQLNRVSDLSDAPHSTAYTQDVRTRRKPNSAQLRTVNDDQSQADVHPERPAQYTEGWWLRDSVEAWERLVDATELELAPQSSSEREISRHSSERLNPPQKRTALSLLRDEEFARRVALRLASASVIEDRADWKSIQSWTVVLAERCALPKQARPRPLSADTVGMKNVPKEINQGLEAAAYLKTILHLVTNLVTVKCDVDIIVRFCERTELPEQVIKLIRAMLTSETLQQRPWYEQILLDLIIAINAYFVSEIGHCQTAPESAIQSYTEHALCFMELVSQLINQRSDDEYLLRDQTLLCLRSLMERMVDRNILLVEKFYSDLANNYLSTVKDLLYMPSISRRGSVDLDAQRLDDIREHALAAITAFTYPLVTKIVISDDSQLNHSLNDPISSWITGSSVVSIQTHKIAAFIAQQLCLPEFATHMRLYVSYLWMPRLCIHTAKLFYDCIQADASFGQHCTNKVPAYLEALFELLQKKIALSNVDQFTVTEIVIHSLSVLTIQLGCVPDLIRDMYPKFYRMFVESQVPSHAAALALLLSRMGPLDCSNIPFKPRDLVQAISRVLVSPLAQSQSSRSRLLWAMSESTIATANHGISGQVDPVEAFELPMTLGIPQFNWPASHGWLDGVFEMALNQCTQMDTVFMYHWTETKLHDRLWQCLEHVFNLGGCTDVTLPTHPAPDWSMLSPRGVCVLLRLACMVYTKEMNLYGEEIRKSHSPMLSCVNYIFKPMFIKNVLDKQYLEHELLTNLGRVATKLHADNAAFVSSKTVDKNCIQMIHLSRIQALLFLIFRICSGPFLEEDQVVSGERPSSNLKSEPMSDSKTKTEAYQGHMNLLRNHLSALFLEYASADGSVTVGQFVQIVRWCLSCLTADLRAGACVILNRALVCQIVEDFPKRVKSQTHSSLQLSRSTGQLVWSTLMKSEAESSEHRLSAEGCILHDLLADTDAVVVTQALNLFANLCLLTPSGSSDYESIAVASLRRSSSVCYTIGDFYNQKVHRATPQVSVKTDDKLIPNTDSLWHSLYEPFVKLSAKSLDAEQTTVRQAALLVLGNALYRFEGAREMCIPLLDKINKLLTEDASARVRANAAGVFGNLSLHVNLPVETLLQHQILGSLLETGCLDGDRRVQEASLAALRSICSMDKRLRQKVSSLGAAEKLQKLKVSMKRSHSSRLGRKQSLTRQLTPSKSNSFVECDVIIAHAAAICNCLTQ